MRPENAESGRRIIILKQVKIEQKGQDSILLFQCFESNDVEIDKLSRTSTI